MGNKILKALLGFIWYPISTAARLLLLTLGVCLLIPAFIIGIPIAVARDSWRKDHHFLGALGLGISTLIAVIAIGAPLSVAAFVSLAAVSFLISPILGVIKGWQEGIGAVWSNGLNPLPIEAWVYNALNLSSRGQQEDAQMAAAIEASNREFLRATLSTLTRDEFNSLILEPAAFQALKSGRTSPLSEDEKARIRAIGDSDINELLQNYEKLQHTLKIDECPLLLDRPARKDTILLMKQYRQGAEKPWLVVPASSGIYSKTQLRTALSIDARHPIFRDYILRPEQYKGFETRYVFHAFYTDDFDGLYFRFFGTSTPDLEGVSQELTMRASFLRACLGDTLDVSSEPPMALSPPMAPSIAPAGPFIY